MIEIEHDDYGEDDYGEDDYGEEDHGEEETETVPCRGCGTDVYADALQCPVCGEYVTGGASLLASRPRWFLILGAVGVVVLIVALVVG